MSKAKCWKLVLAFLTEMLLMWRMPDVMSLAMKYHNDIILYVSWLIMIIAAVLMIVYTWEDKE